MRRLHDVGHHLAAALVDELLHPLDGDLVILLQPQLLLCARARGVSSARTVTPQGCRVHLHPPAARARAHCLRLAHNNDPATSKACAVVQHMRWPHTGGTQAIQSAVSLLAVSLPLCSSLPRMYVAACQRGDAQPYLNPTPALGTRLAVTLTLLDQHWGTPAASASPSPGRSARPGWWSRPSGGTATGSATPTCAMARSSLGM